MNEGDRWSSIDLENNCYLVFNCLYCLSIQIIIKSS